MHLDDLHNFDNLSHIQTPQPNMSQSFRPLHTHMSNYESRCSSFLNWPNHIKTRSEVFAAAGFFYLGQGDRLKCFYCDGILQDWHDDDEPWFEHAKWYPTCDYLLWSKGTKFVQEISNRYSYINRSVSFSDQDLNCMTSSLRFQENQQAPIFQPSSESSNPSLICCNSSNSIKNDPTLTKSMKKTASNERLETTQAQVVFSNRTSQESSTLLNDNSDLQRRNLDAKIFVQKRSLLSQTTRHIKESFKTTNSTNLNLLNSNLNKNEIKKKISMMVFQETCKVCFDRKSDCLFFPCRHLCCCIECASSLSFCPLCRKDLKKIIKIYRE